LRLRYEGFKQADEFHDGRRDRFRYRLRVGLEVDVTDFLRAGFQVRSGDPNNPVSDNQSLDAGFNKDKFSLAQVYADVDVSDAFSFIGGKFAAGDSWITSDMHWDEDVVIEGLMEHLSVGGGDGAFKKLEATVYQLVLEESGDNVDAWLLGFQARPTFQLGKSAEITFGAGFDSFVEPQSVVDLTLDGKLTGNKVTNLLDESGHLVSDFRIFNAFFVWKYPLTERWPLRAYLYWYKNAGAKDVIGTESAITGAELLSSENNTAFFGRIQIGSYANPGQVLVRYSRYLSEPDALFYAFMQSDTRRSSNLDGNRIDVRIGMPARGYVNITYYRTKPSRGEDTVMHRWQFDYIIRF
jgi:hypothetical protein